MTPSEPKVKRHTTHFSDCGCLTHRYKIAIIALSAIKAHWDIVHRGSLQKVSTVSYILDRTFKALEDFDKELLQ